MIFTGCDRELKVDISCGDVYEVFYLFIMIFVV